MTGHAFQCLLADDDILQAFLAVAAVLAPGRQFVFETRNPACAPWQNWVPARSEIALVTADDVAVRLWHQLVEITDDYVTFDQYHAFADRTAPVISRSCLRFCTLAQIEAFATAAGLRVVWVVSDWKGAAFTGIERRDYRTSSTGLGPAAQRLCGGPARRPGPLEIIPAQPAGHVHRLTDEIQIRHGFTHHRL